MPIEIGDYLQQTNRAANVTGPGFFYLTESSNINFGVEGFVENSWSGTINYAYDTKYVVNDVAAFETAISPATVPGLAVNDIVTRVEGAWKLWWDASNSQANQGGIVVYNKWDGNLYYFDNSSSKGPDGSWVEVGTGAGGAGGSPGGPQWAIQFNYNEGLSGSSKFRFDESGNKVVLGSDVKIEFGDGTTQSTARNFYGLTSTTDPTKFPAGVSHVGHTGDRLLVATGPSGDPFRNYVRFGNQWFQYGVAGIASGPRGIPGSDGARGATGETGATGATGVTGSGLTAVSVNASGILTAKYLFNGSESAVFEIGYVKGQTGFTGPTGSTGNGVTGFEVIGDDLYYWYMGPDGLTFGSIQNAGNVRGPAGTNGTNGIDGATGATGITGSGLTSLSVDAAGILTAKYLFNGSESAVFEIGYVRGFTGATGSTGAGVTGLTYDQTTGILSAKYIDGNGTLSSQFEIGYVKGDTGDSGLTGFESNNTNLSRSAGSIANSWTGSKTARKVLFLQDDGSITAGYVFNYNIFGDSDFQFRVTGFSRTLNSPGQTGASILRLNNSWYNMSGVAGITFTASYYGDPTTAGIAVLGTNNSQNSPIYFPTAAMDKITGVEHSLQITGIGGSTKQITIRLSATGSYPGGSTVNDTSSYTVKFRNDFLYGTTGASAISNLANMQWNKDFNSARPEAQTVNLYSFPWNATGGAEPYFGYFAYPLRIHVEKQTETNPNAGIIFENSTPLGGNSYGGWNVQGYGVASDANGLSHIDYTNAQGYVEKYIIWRTSQPGLGQVTTTCTTGGNYSYTP